MLNLLDSNIVNAIYYIYKHIFTHISHPKLLATVFQNLDEIKKIVQFNILHITHSMTSYTQKATLTADEKFIIVLGSCKPVRVESKSIKLLDGS